MFEERSTGWLLSRFLEGTLDAAGMEMLARWREESPRHEALFQRVISRDRAGEAIRRFAYPVEEKEREWQAIRRRVARGRRGAVRRRVAWTAVVALLVAAGGMMYHLSMSPPPLPAIVDAFSPGLSPTLFLPDGSRVELGEEQSLESLARVHPGLQAGEGSLSYPGEERAGGSVSHVLRVPRGREYVLTLPDKTVVYLNAETEIVYPTAFPGSCREVSLKGEAYFNVREDTARPFTVHALSVRVEVTGTTFGVRAYEDEPVVQAVLESGRVRVRAGERELSLVPNTRALYDRQRETLEAFPANPASFLGWKQGRLVYDNVPLEMILKDVGRWYSLDVFFTREETRALPFSLNMKKHGSIADVLRLLQETGKVRFSRDDHAITVL